MTIFVIPSLRRLQWNIENHQLGRQHMNAATERMAKVLRARDWKFDVDEKSLMIRTGCNGDNGHSD
jgi:membrane protein YdbS with pleckstrin-like domain